MVTDADGDSVSAELDLDGVFQIEDDGPVQPTVSDAAAMVLDESPLPTDGDGIVSVTAAFAGYFSTPDFGTDVDGTVSYTLELSADGIGSGMYALDDSDTDAGDGDGYGQGDEILLSKVGNDIVGAVGGVTYFTISVSYNFV